MSEFDREAEREKLRKQFERDKERRKSTERMSELLLKGATMTNKHCDVCGSPVFRQNGQEFCPAAADGGHEQQATQEGQGAEQAPAEAQSPEAADPETQPIPEAGEAAGGEADADAPAAHTHATHDHAGTERPPQLAETPVQRPSGGGGDLADARASLARTLTRLATQAEEEDDLGRAREFLAAAKEAAEALEATKRADR